MNKRDFSLVMQAYSDIATVKTPPTRGKNCLDLLATNIETNNIAVEILSPLQNEQGTMSDHNIVFASYMLSKKRKTNWRKYTARKKTDAGKVAFNKLLLEQTWDAVYNAPDPSSKATAFEQIVGGIFNECFPLRTYRVRSDDPPWMTHGIRKRIDQRLSLIHI